MSRDKQAAIAIIGAGCWGLSTAYHLERNGYSNITVFDRASEAPSPFSAANDLNKIVRAQYDDDFYTDIGLKAIEAWKTADWAPYFHQTGHLVTVSGQAPQKAQSHFDTVRQYALEHQALKHGVTTLKDKQDMLDHCWQLTGPLTNFRGYYNRLEGYAHSADALRGITTKLAGSGVKFVLGPEKGHVVELLYTSSGPSSSRRCSGFRTRNNATHTFNTVICALGAYGASLVPQLGAFNVARCWSVAHIQLTPQECEVLRGIPIVNVLDLGFFFEPDPATRLLKMTPLGAGYSNFDDTKTGRRVSLPPGHDGQLVAGQLHDYVPLADEVRMRKLLRETLPWLADRPFVDKKMCWFSDTVDSEYCIDFAPDTDSSLIVLSGDSGHGFKMMPIFGQWVCELLDRGVQQRPGWRWRSVDAGKGGADWGSDVSWRFGESAEIGDVAREMERMVKARL